MFRALKCPFSGGQIVLSQHLVSSLSVNGCKLCPDDSRFSMLSSGILYSRLQRLTIPDAVVIKFCPPEVGHVDARNISRIVM